MFRFVNDAFHRFGFFLRDLGLNGDDLGRLALLSKNYVRSPDGSVVGGIYVWSTRHAAETYFDDAWHDRVTEAYGSEPRFTWFDSPMVLDNRHREILE